MRVQIIVPGRFHLFDLARELNNKGHLVKLVTTLPKFFARRFGLPGDKIQSFVWHEFLWRGFRKLESVFDVPYNPQFFFHNLYSWSAKSSLSEPIDILVCGSSFALPLIKKAKDLGAAIIIERGSSHISYQSKILKEESSITGHKIKFAHPMVEKRELLEYEMADYISVPSRFVEQSFIEYGVPRNKLIRIPYGVDLQRFSPGQKRDSVFRVIHVGSLSLRKGVHYLLEAFHRLNLCDAELVLVGDITKEIKPFLKKYQTANIKAVGSVPQNDLVDFYRQASVFCLASIEEGMAMVILQAMACGLPVICTENTGGGDLIDDRVEGFVVPIRDVDILVQRFKFLHENNNRLSAMAIAANEKIRTKDYSWGAYGEGVIAEYQLLLKKRSVP